MLCVMDTPVGLDNTTSFRTSRRLKQQLKARIATLVMTGPNFRDEEPTMEAVLTALMHWFVRVDFDEAREFLDEEFDLLDRYLGRGQDNRPDSGEMPARRIDLPGPKKPRR